jgi:hypothetical protein
MEAPIARLQHHRSLHHCGLMDDSHDFHVSIIHGDGQVMFEASRETREAGVIIGVKRHRIEAIRSLTWTVSCAARPHPSIDLVTARRGDG